MDAIIMSLMAAREQHLLINVYQTDVTDFYTGYVEAVADDGVVLQTYNDAGLADGSAYVARIAIDSIEVGGPDIDMISYRMQKSADHGFTAMPAAPLRLPLNADNPLLYQVAENMRRSGQAVVVVSLDSENYLEGQITTVTQTSLQLEVFNKFNYSDKRTVTLDFNSVCSLEFEGYDLFLESVLLSHRSDLQHEPTSRYRNSGQMGKILPVVRDSKQLVAIITRVNTDNFYVGRVQAVSDDFVVMQMLDMAGQFGGYALIRLRNIAYLLTDSDYVQTISFYEGWAEKQHFVQAPGLNRRREFTDGADFLEDILQEADIMGKVLRVRSAQTVDAVQGRVVEVTDNGFGIEPVGDGSEATTTFKNSEVLDVTFDSVYGYLQEEWLRDNDES
ncbi:hypothetical protein PQ472_12115 [Lacticaseibacillus pabuli]|uniref:Uncharacterized protein n=1 Tax=Lacticaseibacillus pabuli TaxID=3025672 RepID=A0ABY7WR83_9LACO|nr:hypothetical protein [Lacticaseibacillus sp. KACC 23028]WDF82621.1 hypothetical protein PQ472_12115 [Lacticaseibacillus sp. KACC 23028]